jgi:nicotinamide mononucleotide transporter
MSVLELAAVILALAYLILAIRQDRWCWVAGGSSAILYGIIFVSAKLYMEASLQSFYLIMAIYGWLTWGRPAAGNDLTITRWTTRTHLVLAVAVAIGSIAIGGLLDQLTDAAWPVIDSFTTLAALVATYMVARKVLENWLWWIVIDTVSVGLYLSRDLHLTALLFCGYVILAAAGWLTWRRQLMDESPV